MPDNQWMNEAACLGITDSRFFPTITDDKGEEWIDDGTIYEAFGPTDEFYDDAREICDICPVRELCLQNAMQEKERYGFWGGLTPLERRRIERRERRAKRAERLKEEAENGE